MMNPAGLPSGRLRFLASSKSRNVNLPIHPNPAGLSCGPFGFVLQSKRTRQARTCPVDLPTANQPGTWLGRHSVRLARNRKLPQEKPAGFGIQLPISMLNSGSLCRYQWTSLRDTRNCSFLTPSMLLKLRRKTPVSVLRPKRLRSA
jgi:hypothetical protein